MTLVTVKLPLAVVVFPGAGTTPLIVTDIPATSGEPSSSIVLGVVILMRLVWGSRVAAMTIPSAQGHAALVEQESSSTARGRAAAAAPPVAAGRGTLMAGLPASRARVCVGPPGSGGTTWGSAWG